MGSLLGLLYKDNALFFLLLLHLFIFIHFLIKWLYPTTPAVTIKKLLPSLLGPRPMDDHELRNHRFRCDPTRPATRQSPKLSRYPTQHRLNRIALRIGPFDDLVSDYEWIIWKENFVEQQLLIVVETKMPLER